MRTLILSMLLVVALISIVVPVSARGAPNKEKQIASHVVTVNATVQTEQDLSAVSASYRTLESRFDGATASTMNASTYSNIATDTGPISDIARPEVVLLA